MIFTFELEVGWRPRSLLDTLKQRTDFKVKSMANFQNRLSNSFLDRKFGQHRAQSLPASYHSQKYNVIPYKVDNSISLARHLFNKVAFSKQLCRLLGFQPYTSFRILEVTRRNALYLELPKSIQIHHFVNVKHTGHTL